MKRNFLVIILVVALPTLLFSQNRRAERAYEAFNAGEYYEAIDLFKDAYSKTKDKAVKSDMVFMVSECYRLVNDPKNAETWYKKAVRDPGVSPVAQLWLAESMKKEGKYQQAVDEYRKYKQLVPNDARADLGIRSCELALEWLRSPEGYLVQELRELNSKDSDFGPAFVRDDHALIYFTSSRDDVTGNKRHGATGQAFTDIFESRLDKKGKWSTPVPVEGINSESEEGTPSVSFDYREIYFTRCEAGKREQRGCVIMYSQKSGAAWSDPKNLGLLSDSLVAAHPAITPDGLTLYFVSELPGGFGGKDIYYSTRQSKEGAWTKAANIGPDINTKGDELFPYVREDGTLYFSSDGHMGMGGLDIFKAVAQSGGNWLITNRSEERRVG